MNPKFKPSQKAVSLKKLCLSVPKKNQSADNNNRMHFSSDSSQ